MCQQKLSEVPKKPFLWILPQTAIKVGVFPCFWQSSTSSQHSLSQYLSIVQEFHRWNSEKENPVSVCIDFVTPPINTKEYPCGEFLTISSADAAEPVPADLGLFCVFLVSPSALSGSFAFSQYRGSRGTDAALLLLLLEGDSYLSHISASKRELVLELWLPFSSSLHYQKLYSLPLCLLLLLTSVLSDSFLLLT